MSYENGAPMILSFPNGPLHRLAPHVRQVLTTLPDGSELRGRLRDVLGFLLDGLSEKEIAVLLDLSQCTVHAYTKELYTRFGAESRPQLIAFIYPSGLAKVCGTSWEDDDDLRR
jgi:DNA-binding NarL/FixJ family response regulator